MGGEHGKLSGMATKQSEGTKLISKNRQAYHHYEVLESFEAGLVLQGTEVKSLRESQVSFQEAYARFKGEELWLAGMHIPVYAAGSYMNHEPTRLRKMLLHKRELKRLRGRVDRQGLTLVPLELYFRRGYAKVKLGLCKGRKLHDKRQALRKKQDQRQMERHIQDRGR